MKSALREPSGRQFAASGVIHEGWKYNRVCLDPNPAPETIVDGPPSWVVAALFNSWNSRLMEVVVEEDVCVPYRHALQSCANDHALSCSDGT